VSQLVDQLVSWSSSNSLPIDCYDNFTSSRFFHIRGSLHHVHTQTAQGQKLLTAGGLEYR